MCLGHMRLEGCPALVYRVQKEACPLSRETFCERVKRLFVLCGRQLHRVQPRKALRKRWVDDDGAHNGAQGRTGRRSLCVPRTLRSTGAA